MDLLASQGQITGENAANFHFLFWIERLSILSNAGRHWRSVVLCKQHPRTHEQAALQKEDAKGCAAAVLVGLDVSPQPGLRGPTNFAGVCGPALLQEMDTVLIAADTKFR